MANTAQFDIIINAVGHLEKAIKELKTMGSETAKTTKNTKELSKAQDEVNYKLNQGVTGVSASARSFSKLSQTIGDGPNGLVGAYATLAANAFAVSAAFNALRQAAQVEQMMKGLEVQSARTGVSLRNVSQEVQKLTGYSVSAADAMKTTALMSSAGFSTKGMEDLTKVATNAAFALGRTVPDSLDRLSKGVTKLEPELLDELGIMTKLSEAQSRYALENNKTVGSLTSFEKRQAMLNAVIAEGTAKFGGLSEEVAANPFDQLGASFQNLINNILSIVNTIAGPLAAIFSNQGLLFGGLILFISTIRQQLLPVLYLMGKAANDRRQHFVDMAADARDAAKATLELADAQQKAAMSSKMERFVGPEVRTKATSKGFDYEAAAIAAVDQDAAAHAKNISALDRSISSRMKNIRIERGELTEEETKAGVTAKGWSEDYIKNKQKELDSIKKVKAELEDLYKTQKEGEQSVIAARTKSRVESAKFRANEKAALAEKLKGEAIELAGEGNIRDAWAKRGEALEEYQRKLRYERVAARTEGVRQLPPAFDKIKQFGAGIASGAQIGAAAFMRFIPYIGIAVTAASALYAGWEKWGKSDAAKAQSKALEKFKETVDTAKDSVKELKRLQESNIDVGLKAASTFTIQSNATAGIADALKEVQKAQTEALDTKKVDSWFEAFTGGRQAMISYQTGVGTEDDMFSAIENAYGGNNGKVEAIGAGIGAVLGGGIVGYFTGGLGAAAGATIGGVLGGSLATYVQSMLPEELNGIDEGALESARAVSHLSKIIGEDLTKNMVAAAGGADKLAESPALQREFIRQAASAFLGVADAVKTVQEGFKQTGDALTNFFTNAIPKTAFDGIVTGLRQTNKGFKEMDLTLGGSNIVEQTKLLASMPQELERMLTPASATILQNVRKYGQEIDSVRQQIQDLASRENELSNADQDRLTSLRGQLPVLIDQQKIEAQKGTQIREQLKALEQQNVSAQRQSRSYQNQLSLVNAIASANSDIYSKSVAGERARISRHNEALRLQQAQLQIQINITQTYIQQQEIAIQALETKMETLKAERDIAQVRSTSDANAAQAARDQARATLIQLAGNETLSNQIEERAKALSDANLSVSNIRLTNTENKPEDFVAAARGLVAAEVAFQRASRVSRTVIDIEERTAAIQEFRDNNENLRTQIAAISQAEIRAGEEAALLQKRANEIKLESIARAAEIVSLGDENNQIERNTNNLYAKRSIELQENIRATIRQANIDKENQARQSGATLQRLRDDQAVYRARLADRRDMDARERASYLEAIANLDIQIEQEEQINRLTQEKIELTAKQAILETIVGGGVEETINRLKESLDLRKQELEVASQLRQKQLEVAQNAARISIARTGADVSQRAQRAFEVESAELAYKTAQEEHQLRLRAIDAEYALLEAKKNVDAQSLRTQATLLQAYNRIFNNGRSNPELDAMISNVTTAATTLENINTNAMRVAARAGANADLELARQRRDLARAQYEGERNPQNNAFQVFTNYVAEAQAMRRADIISTEKIASEQIDAQLRYSAQELELNREVVNNLVRMNTELSRIREAVVPVLTATETAEAATESPTTTGRGNIATRVSANMNRATFLAATKGYFGGDDRSISSPTNEDIRNYINRVSTREGNDSSRNRVTGAMGRLQFMPATLRGLAGNNAGLASNDRSAQYAAWMALSPQQKDALYQQYARQNFNALKASIGRNPTEAEWYAAQFGIGNISQAIRSPESELTRDQRAAYSGNTPALVRGLATYLASNPTAAISAPMVATSAPVAATAATTPVAPATAATPSGESGFRSVLDNMEGPIPPIAINLEQDEAFLELQRRIREELTLVAEKMRQKKEVAKDFLAALPAGMQVVEDQLAQLGTAMTERLGTDFGPQGRVMTSLTGLISTFSITIPNALSVLNEDYAAWADRNKEMVSGMDEQVARTIHSAQQIGGAFQAAAAIIGSISSLLKSISDSKIAGIDKEIAAEQKRDGKSAQSAAKLEALEKKKDNMARKSFNTQKKLMMAQAVMSTAAAVAGTYAALAKINPAAAIAMAAVVGALGLAQVAIIAGTSYESSATTKSPATPSTLSIGKRSESVDLASGPNANAGGEVGYLRGSQGTGSNASNYRTIGSAYGGELMRGYGNRGFVVGEKGPEVITPETPISVTPANDVGGAQPINANFNIHAIDSQGVQDVLVAQKGNIIKMLREAANASGKSFMEDVNVNVYTRPSVGKL